MKNLVVFVLLLLAGVIAHGQAKQAHRQIKEKHYPVPKLYHDVGKFHNGLASAMYDGKYGFIDTGGREVIKCIYDRAGDFVDGFSVVQLKELKGVIDTNGNVIVPIEYDEVENQDFYGYNGNWNIKDCFIVRKDSKYGKYFKSGKLAFPCQYNSIAKYNDRLYLVSVGDRFGLINDSGRSLTPIKYPYLSNYISEGYIKMADSVKGSRIYGLIDTNGVEKVKCQYQEIYEFNNGIAPVQKNGKWGCLNKKGSLLLRPIYDKPPQFEQNYIIVSTREKYGVVNLQGQIEIPLKYAAILGTHDDDFWSGHEYGRWGINNSSLVPVMNLQRKFGVFDTNGRQILPFAYDTIQPFFCGLAGFKQGQKWGFIDSSGNIIVPASFDKVEPFYKGYAKVENKGRVGVIDKSGTVKIPCKFLDLDAPSPFNISNYPVIAIGSNHYKGLVDSNGNTIVGFKYCEITNLHEGNLFLVTRDLYKFGILRGDGKEVIPTKYYFSEHKGNGLFHAIIDGFQLTIDTNGKIYEDTGGKIPYQRNAYNKLCNFHNGLALARNNAFDWGYIDKKGTEVIPCEFYDARDFSNNYARVKKEEDWFLIDRTGKRVFEEVYDTVVNDFNQGYITVKKHGKYGLMDTTGKLILDFKFDRLGEYNNGLVPGLLNKKAGYFNLQGDLVLASDYIPPMYKEDICMLAKGDTLVVTRSNGAVITQLGNRRFFPGIDRQSIDIRFSEGLILVQIRTGLCGGTETRYMDFNGEDPVGGQYLLASEFKNGLAIVYNRIYDGNSTSGVIDKKGNWVIPPGYDFVSGFSNDGIASVKIKGKYGFINPKNKIIIPAIYDAVGGISDDKNGWIAVEKNNEWGYINKAGKRILWFK